MKIRRRHQIVFVLLSIFVPSSLSAFSIQAVIDAAKPGDRIQIPTGRYTGDLILSKSVSLVGIGRPVLQGTGNGSVITVLGDGCKIQGFVIERSGKDLQNEDSGILVKGSRTRIEANDIRDVLFGVYLFHSHDNSILHNHITGRSELDEGDRGSGIHIWDSPANRIEDNVISEARDGLFIQNSRDNLIKRNHISNLRYGVHYMFSDRNRFEENIFTNNVAGAAIMYSREIDFRRNLFLHNRGYSSFGILFQECERCFAEENWIVDNVTGLFAEALRNSIIRRNVIAENDVAIQMFSSAEGNIFSENNFVQNLSPMQLVGTGTDTRWQQAGRGNFWSDYDGYDLNEDGIGDVPNQIQNVFEYMESNHPRLRLYLYSVAAAALAVSDRAFPIVKASNDRDTQPLMRAVALKLPAALVPKSISRSVSTAFFSFAMIMTAGTFYVAGWKPKLKSHD